MSWAERRMRTSLEAKTCIYFSEGDFIFIFFFLKTIKHYFALKWVCAQIIGKEHYNVTVSAHNMAALFWPLSYLSDLVIFFNLQLPKLCG